MALRIDLWAPGFDGGGGIQAFSLEVALALRSHDVRRLSREACAVNKKWICESHLSTACYTSVLLSSLAYNRPDLILTTHVNFAPVALLVRKVLNIPYVVVAHGIDVSPKLSARRKQALRSANTVVAVSSPTAKSVSSLVDLDLGRIEILPNTVDESRFKVGVKDFDLLARFGIPHDSKVILTVGRLSSAERYKGYDVIIREMPRILRLVPAAHYVLCGAGDDAERVKLMVKELNLEKHITFTGFLPADCLPRMYRSADVFAMPSTGEGFGIVFLEALASGVPVLAGNLDGSVDALNHGEFGVLVDPHDDVEVANGIVSLLRKEGLHWWFEPTELRERMLKVFGREQFSRKLNNIVAQFLQ